MPVVVQAAVEGPLDEAVARRLIRDAGLVSGTVYGHRGKQYLRDRITGYNNAARVSPWLVIVDLNHDHACAPALRAEWLPGPAPDMTLRVAIREVEAWLLADRQRFARFLGVAQATLPRDPEAIDDPKQFVVNLARRSSRRDVREDLVPRESSGRTTGTLYVPRLIDFVEGSWRPGDAATIAPSLDRCLFRLRELAG